MLSMIWFSCLQEDGNMLFMEVCFVNSLFLRGVKFRMLAVLFGQGEVLVIIVIIAVLVFILARRRR